VTAVAEAFHDDAGIPSDRGRWVDGGLKWSITAVRDARAREKIPGPSPVTTIRLLDRSA
jgi:hypothetical protein